MTNNNMATLSRYYESASLRSVIHWLDSQALNPFAVDRIAIDNIDQKWKCTIYYLGEAQTLRGKP